MSEEGVRSPFTRWPFILGAAMVVVLVVSLVFLLATRDSSPRQRASSMPAVTEPSAASPVAASGGGDVSVCGLAAGDQDVPGGWLGAQTVTVGDGLTVPAIDGVGPGITEGVSHCFAHSPTGSVLAAANFMRWFSSRQQLDEAAEQLIAPGTDRDRMVESINTTWDGSTVAPFNILGYKVQIRSDDEVLVTLAVSQPEDVTAMTSWPLVMVWQDGDWLVRLSPNDSWGERAITNLQGEGFTQWATY